MAREIARWRTVAILLAGAIAWVALDHVLRALSLPRIDPFPYVWMQRFTIVFNLATLAICARARRALLLRRARRDAEEEVALRAALRPSALRSRDMN